VVFAESIEVSFEPNERFEVVSYPSGSPSLAPTYEGVLFLGNSADELSYLSYPSDPYNVKKKEEATRLLVERANATCQFFEFANARFIRSTSHSLWPSEKVEMITVFSGGLGMTEFHQKSNVANPTYIHLLQCVR
jgi:hypothetical protein